MRIRIRIGNADPDPGEPNQCGSWSITLLKIEPGSGNIYLCVSFFRERRVWLSILVGRTELRDQVWHYCFCSSGILIHCQSVQRLPKHVLLLLSYRWKMFQLSSEHVCITLTTICSSCIVIFLTFSFFLLILWHSWLRLWCLFSCLSRRYNHNSIGILY